MSSRGRRGSYWCHQCTRTVRIYSHSGDGTSVICPHCNGGFIQQVESPSSNMGEHYPFGYHEEEEGPIMRPWHSVALGGEPNPSADDHPITQMMESLAAFLNTDDGQNDNPHDAASRLRRRRARFGMDLAGFNPLMFLQGHMVGATAAGGNMEIFYDNGTGTGPSRLPGNIGDYFLGPGLDELIQQLADNDPNRYGPPPASKTAVEAMPTISITKEHLGPDSVQCAVCKDEFEIGSEVKQMPCKHLYHPDCILPWLAQHNSCPVCRYEMPTDDPDYNQSRESSHWSRGAGAALGHNSNFSLLGGGSRPPGGNGFGWGAVNNELQGSGYTRPSAPSQQPSNAPSQQPSNAVSRNRGFRMSVPEPYRSFISMSQQAQAETGVGPANSGETVSSSPNDGNDVQWNTSRIDDDGDTVMSEARQDQLD